MGVRERSKAKTQFDYDQEYKSTVTSQTGIVRIFQHHLYVAVYVLNINTEERK